MFGVWVFFEFWCLVFEYYLRRRLEMSDQKRSKWRLYVTIATFVALGVLIYSLRQQIADVIKELGRINAAALLLIIPLKVINFDSYARLYKDLFKTLGNRVGYWAMYKLSLELNFVNYILPSGGGSGISYFTIRGRSERINTIKNYHYPNIHVIAKRYVNNIKGGNLGNICYGSMPKRAP